MQQEEIDKKLRELSVRRQELLESLVAPARAAVNALKDAQRPNTAEPLNEILFQIDALHQEIMEFVKTDPINILEALFKRLEQS
jgi:hypothetical protein